MEYPPKLSISQSDDRAETLTGIETDELNAASNRAVATIGLKPLQGLKRRTSLNLEISKQATIGLKPLQGLKPLVLTSDDPKSRDDRAETLTGIETI